MSGTGDSVCFILNDLLNWELYRQKYTFQKPDYSHFGEGLGKSYVEIDNFEQNNTDINFFPQMTAKTPQQVDRSQLLLETSVDIVMSQSFYSQEQE